MRTLVFDIIKPNVYSAFKITLSNFCNPSPRFQFCFIIKFITTQLKTSVQLLKAVNTFGINQNSNSVSIKRAVKLKAVENNTLLETAPSKVT